MSTHERKPGDSDEDRLLDHDADGIQEYDNPMPRWWLWIFWITIAWSVLYGINLIPGVGTGRGRESNYAVELANAEAKYGAARAAAASKVSAAAIWALAGDATAMAAAKRTFTTTCAACHLQDGGGSIGPNLTDDFWIHGGQPMDIHSTISAGVLDKGMPAWGEALAPEAVLALAAYVTTLHGKTPARAKAPQGTKVAYEAGRPVAGEAHDHASHESGAAEKAQK